MEETEAEENSCEFADEIGDGLKNLIVKVMIPGEVTLFRIVKIHRQRRAIFMLFGVLYMWIKQNELLKDLRTKW